MPVPGQHVAQVGRQRVEVHEVHPGHLSTGSTAALHGGVDGGPGRAPADDAQLGVLVALHLDGRDVGGHRRHLGRPQVDHLLVVLGGVGDVARPVPLLLDAADAMHQARRAGDGPRPRQRVRLAQVWPELRRAVGGGVVGLGGERHGDVGEIVNVGQLPRLGAVGQITVGQEDHRRAVLDRDAGRLDGGLEAVHGAHGRDDGQAAPHPTARRGRC